MLAQQDKARIKKFWKVKHIDPELESSPLKALDTLFKMSAQPLNSHCHVLKRIGGVWFEPCGFLDGEKLICMDPLYQSVINNNCLIYSFGLGKSSAKNSCNLNKITQFRKEGVCKVA